ncbi:MAG: rhodanese-like domain-containing protein [Microthrixaceae bacterium]
MLPRRHIATPRSAALALLASLLIPLLLASCTGDSEVKVPEAKAGTVVKLDSQQGRALLKSGDHALLIDTRTVPEYIRGHLVGAQNVDMANDDAWDFRVAEFDLGRPTVVYCRDDDCSREAADRLVAAGLRHVYDLGNPDDWDHKYLPIEGRRSDD